MYHEANIRDELLPRLVRDGTFSNGSDTLRKIQKCDIVRLSASEAFMLTMCYRVKLALSTEDDGHSKVFNLILKVKACILFKQRKIHLDGSICLYIGYPTM